MWKKSVSVLFQQGVGRGLDRCHHADPLPLAFRTFALHPQSIPCLLKIPATMAGISGPSLESFAQVFEAPASGSTTFPPSIIVSYALFRKPLGRIGIKGSGDHQNWT
jgi:hypothetical protein